MRIFVSGSVAIDRIMSFSGNFSEVIQPDKLHVLSLSVLLDSLHDTRGGTGANIAYNLALLGEKPVLLSSVGESAKSYLTELSEMGVDVSLCHFSDLPTASFTVLTDQANNQVGGFYPGAMGDAASLTLESVDPERDMVVIAPHDPDQMRSQVAHCAKHKIRLVYDVGQQVSNSPEADLRAGVEAAEVMILNDFEFGVLLKRTGWDEAAVLSHLKTCVVTLGEAGSRYWQSGEWHQVPAVQEVDVLDPTGAGDAFRAGFLAGYSRGWPLTTCLQLGSVVAAYAIESHGTQEHRCNWLSVSERFQREYGTPLPEK